MPERIVPKNAHEIFNDRQRLIEAHPELAQSFIRFLKDWKRYTRNQAVSKKKGVIRNSTFGAIFKKEA